MILVDDRGHEPPLLPCFKPYVVEVESVIMDSSDIMFAGNGPNGTVSIGMERKRINDLASSVRSQRLGGFQLDGLLEFDYPFIVVEGIYRNGKDGLLETMHGHGFNPLRLGSQPMMYAEVHKFLTSMQLICGIHVLRTTSPEETAHCTVLLYQWFQKEWTKHKAHKGIYAPVPEKNRVSMVRRKPSLCVKIAAQLPHVDSKAWQVAEYFQHDVRFMLAAGEDAWKESLGIKGKKSKIVQEIMEAI